MIFPVLEAIEGGNVVTLSFLRPDGLVHSEARIVQVLPAGSALQTPATGVVRAFLQAVIQGRTDAAWALLTPGAQAAMGRAAFDDAMRSALPEGLGAFAMLPDDAYEIRRLFSDGRQPYNVVVTVAGEITREGSAEFDAVAFAVLDQGVGYHVEWTLDSGVLPVATAWPGGAIGDAPDGGLYFGAVTLPDGATEPALSEPGVDAAGPIDSSAGVTYFEVAAEPAGRRVFAVSYVDGDGLVHAEAGVYNI